MAISTLTAATMNFSGIEGKTDTASYTALAVEGLQVINDGNTFVHIVNGGASTCVVTLDTPQPCSYGSTTLHDETISIPSGDDYFIGPFRRDRFNASETGYVTMTIDQADTITARAYKLVHP